jgi:hypothetical protein
MYTYIYVCILNCIYFLYSYTEGKFRSRGNSLQDTDVLVQALKGLDNTEFIDGIEVCICVYKYLYAHICIYINYCVYMYTYICIYVNIHMYIFIALIQTLKVLDNTEFIDEIEVCICVYIFICIYACVYMFILCTHV